STQTVHAYDYPTTPSRFYFGHDAGEGSSIAKVLITLIVGPSSDTLSPILGFDDFAVSEAISSVPTNPSLAAGPDTQIDPDSDINLSGSGATTASALYGRSDVVVLQDYSSFTSGSNAISFDHAGRPCPDAQFTFSANTAGNSGGPISNTAFSSSFPSSMRMQYPNPSPTESTTYTMTINLGRWYEEPALFETGVYTSQAVGFTLSAPSARMNLFSSITVEFIDADGLVLSTQSVGTGDYPTATNHVYFGYDAGEGASIATVQITLVIGPSSEDVSPILGFDDLALSSAIRAPAQIVSRSVLLNQAVNDPDLADERASLLAQADSLLTKSIITRPWSVDDIANSRIAWDDRYLTADESYRVEFALSRSDAMASAQVRTETMLMATAYAMTGDTDYLDWLVAQLDELADWNPLQRPGWSDNSRGAPAPPEGDGVWQATGYGIQAFVDAIDILPAGSLDSTLLQKIDALMQREIGYIIYDWENEIPWFVKSQAVYSNQWAFPITGLINATVYLGPDQYPDEYEYGIQAMLETLDSQGPDGAFVEGLSYAHATMRCIFSAVYHSTLDGERRLIDHPFMVSYPSWVVHHLQAGGYIVNTFDNFYGSRDGARYFISEFADMAVMFNDPESLWVVHNYGEISSSINGMIARAIPSYKAEKPTRYTSYEYARMATWRSSWEKVSSGLWFRGGHEDDNHDHMDRGHISFIVDGEPILIEAGVDSYSHPQYLTHFKSPVGHNVLQVGDINVDTATWDDFQVVGQQMDAAHRNAPLTIYSMDDDGGEIYADMSNSYPAAKTWVRDAVWDDSSLSVYDVVELDTADTVIFRWHLGVTSKEVVWARGITPAGTVTLGVDGNGNTLLTADNFQVTVQADQPIVASIETLPDKTLGNDSEHYCLVIRSLNAVTSIDLQTDFVAIE
ncbi:MAG: heparinase II/III domain-containing protein, partial [Puniceicoccales bacterium]